MRDSLDLFIVSLLFSLFMLILLTLAVDAEFNNVKAEISRQELRIQELESEIDNLHDEIDKLDEKIYVGQASYYSEDGCIGCREDRIMANGQRFDEDALILACNKIPLNSIVTVINLATGDKTTAKVTDTGGFDKLGRIADLSKGLKNEIGCADLCDVGIIIDE